MPRFGRRIADHALPLLDFHSALGDEHAGVLVWEVQPEGYTKPWEMDLTKYAVGTLLITARPELTRNVARFIYIDATHRSYLYSKRIHSALSIFWNFLNDIEQRTGSEIRRVADITSEMGHLFKFWLLTENKLTASTARSALLTIRRIMVESRKLCGVPDAQLAWPTIKRDQDILHRDVDPKVLIPLYHELKRRHRMTHAMIAEGAKLLEQGEDPRLVEAGTIGNPARATACSKPANMAWLTNAWIEQTFKEPRTRMKSFGGQYFSQSPPLDGGVVAPSQIPVDQRTAFDVTRWFLPGIEDVAAAFFLTLLHTGWNPETVTNIDVASTDSWCDHRLGAPDQEDDRLKTVAIYGFKNRTGKEQIAFSLTRPRAHPYQVIASMIRWTEPMRVVMREKLAELTARTKGTKEDRKSIAELREYIASPWLYFSPQATGPLGLRIAMFQFSQTRNDVLRKIGETAYESALRSSKTDADREAYAALLSIQQSDLRDGFAAFLYENSLYNALLVKRALGHGSLRATRHYLRQKRHVAQRFKEFRQFQTVFFDEVQRFKAVDPTILFLRLRHGEITPEQRARLRDHRIRTRMAMGCLEPNNPPPEIVGDRSGPCRVHRCTICRHGVVFEDSFDGLAKRQAELRFIRGRVASERFQGSSFQDEWIALEWIVGNCFEHRLQEFDQASNKHHENLIAGRAYLFDQIPL